MKLGKTQGETTGWRSYRLFYSQFREHFVNTGAIAPSGPPLAHAITTPLARAERGGGLRVLEVGAGTGAFTAVILKLLRRGDRLDVYEINPAFQPVLEARLAQSGARERGVKCALHMVGICQAPPDVQYDFIISALPLNNFPAAEVERILGLLMSHLRPDGVLSYFEYPFLRQLKGWLVQNPAERARLQAVGEVVGTFLHGHPNRVTAVPWNLPPAIARHVRPA